MADNLIGELRRSTVVMTFGPGAVVDYRADGAPVSAVTAGLEEWDRNFPPQGLLNAQTIFEPRLQRKLGVAGFRLPPVFLEDFGKTGTVDRRALVGARFPDWLQCPECDRIAPSKKWSSDPGRAYRYCPSCTAQKPGQRKVFTIPVRFVVACESGHLEDFPWDYWVGHKESCKQTRSFLKLSADRPGLAGMILSCPKCKAWRSMDGIFGKDTGFQCSGKRPWLATAPVTCNSKNPPRALQRGASNLYFPVVDSALSIPPWSDRLQEAIGVFWSTIASAEPEDRPAFIRILSKKELKPVLEEFGISHEALAALIEERLSIFSGEEILDIRKEEYRQFTARTDARKEDDREFEIRNVSVPATLAPYFSHVVRAVRIREIRALRGFTRIKPPGGEDRQEIAAISLKKLEWLPAIEVRGEGVFLALNQAKLSEWEQNATVRERAAIVDATWRAEWRERYGGGDPEPRITPRYLLVHSFSHALMRQLTLECGYSSASIRERLYVSEEGMAGVLIYTATSDSDGTLGGLQRQGEPARIERAVLGAVRSMEWCSSDPLCINGMVSARETHSLSACHACVHAPETACEQYNRFLDRAMLIGLPGNGAVGYFSQLLKGN